jgi:hypothetical protein
MASCEIRGLTDCNFASETDGTSLRQCEGTRDGILVNLQDAKMPIPEDCQGPPVPKD